MTIQRNVKKQLKIQGLLWLKAEYPKNIKEEQAFHGI